VILASSHTLPLWAFLGEEDMRNTRLVVLWLVLGVAPLSCAAQVVSEERDLLRNSYFGLNVGVADYRFRNPPPGVTSDLCGANAFDCNNNPVGWKATAGYMILPYFGIEAVGYSMGEARAKTDLGGGNTLQQKVRIDGFGVSAVGELPLGPVSLNARLGYAASSAVRKDDINGVSQGRTEHSRGEPIIGAGVGVRVYRGLFVRFDWDRVRAESDLGEKFEADLFSAGIGWRF
jgi:hypothetical protein